MGIWTNVIIVVHVLVALAIIGLVLLQHGKGADMGSGFGGGASGSRAKIQIKSAVHTAPS